MNVAFSEIKALFPKKLGTVGDIDPAVAAAAKAEAERAAREKRAAAGKASPY